MTWRGLSISPYAEAEIVKSLRKVMSIVISFALFPKAGRDHALFVRRCVVMNRLRASA